MLPYRQRPPAWGVKEFRAQKEQQGESTDDFLSDGGPIQRAMEKDLLKLRPVFLGLIESLDAATCGPQQHLLAGDVFKCFKQVFGQAKVALVHTRTVPPRSDRGAYVQLLYSACLSLLKKSFQANDDVVLEHAIYAVFCLYALYETNPLPPEPPSPLQMLTMGLQHPDNPKFLYRRSFRLPIRIDRHHYSLLQRLRDEALARQADCQCARMKAWESRSSTDANNADTCEWTCACGAFIDIVQVIDRLLPNLDLVESTGPAGLDGLVGHADYPWDCQNPKKKRRRGDTATINVLQPAVVKLTDDDLDAIAILGQATGVSSDNLDNMERYKSGLKEIRLASLNMSGSNQAARVRDALKPIFDQSTELSVNDVGGVNEREHSEVVNNSQSDAEEDATEISPQANEPAISTETNGEFGTSRDEDGSTEDVVLIEKKTALEDLNCQLVFPADLPETLRDDIQAALNSAIELGDIKIECRAEPSEERDSFDVDSVAISPRSQLADEESIENGADTRGQGAVALRNLLSAVAGGNTQLNGPSVAANPQRREATASVGILGSNFLTTSTDMIEAEEVPTDSDDSSELLSISSEGSVTGTAIGRMSLQTLLTSVDEGNNRMPTRRKRKQKKRRRQYSSPEKVPQMKKPRKSRQSRKRPIIRDDVLSESSEDSVACIDDVGRAALHALLSAVNESDVQPKGRRQEHENNRVQSTDSPGRRNKKGKKRTRTLMTLDSQEQPKQSTDPPSISSEESVVSIEVGRASLKTLLATVNTRDGGLKRQNQSRGGSEQEGPKNRSRFRMPSRSPRLPEEWDKHSLSSTPESDEEKTEPNTILGDREVEVLDGSSRSDDDSSCSSEGQGQGQSALGALLSLVPRGHNAAS